MLKPKILNIFDRFKYFGLRFLYYRFLRKDFPYLNWRLSDIVEPSLTSRYLSQKIIEEYWGFIGHGAESESPFLGLGLVHYSLIRILKPKRVLCVGSYKGFIPAVCALACFDNKKGRVDFVDAGLDYSETDPILGDGFWRRVDVKKHFYKIVDPKYIESYIMNTSEFAKKSIKRRYGYIYIDGDHTYEGVKRDYRLFWPRLELSGLMTFHDIFGEGVGPVQFGVKRLWSELPDKYKITIPYPKETGLGILQKS